MTDPTRRQIAMMAEEVGITDHDAAVKLVRRAFEVFRPASAALAADGPAVPEGHFPAPPVAGEVGELVALIRQISLAWEPDACLLGNMTAGQLTRASDLLEQRHPEPVPVVERLPGPEDCDAEGRCWLHLPDMGTEPLWRLTDPALRSRYHSHWLPAHALPLPSGEVQP